MAYVSSSTVKAEIKNVGGDNQVSQDEYNEGFEEVQTDRMKQTAFRVDIS